MDIGFVIVLSMLVIAALFGLRVLVWVVRTEQQLRRERTHLYAHQCRWPHCRAYCANHPAGMPAACRGQ